MRPVEQEQRVIVIPEVDPAEVSDWGIRLQALAELRALTDEPPNAGSGFTRQPPHGADPC